METVITSPNPYTPSLLQVVLAGLAILAAVSGGLEAFIRGYRKSLPKENAPAQQAPSSADDWEALCSRANRVVEEIMSQSPPDIAAEAMQVPCLFRERAEKESPGYRLMGTYHNFTPGRKSDHNGPIFLYLKSIEEHCQENNEDFDDKVKKTYLHELGHHFGWDEVDLARQGLPSGRPPGE